MCLCVSLAFLSLKFYFIPFYLIKEHWLKSINWFHDPYYFNNPVLEFYFPGIFLTNVYFSYFKYSGKWS